MIDPHCRIGRVKLRGGADLFIIDRVAARRGNVTKAVVDALRAWQAIPIAGAAMAVWDSRGDVYTMMNTSDGPVDRCLVPAFVQDDLQRLVMLEEVGHASVVHTDPDEYA